MQQGETNGEPQSVQGNRVMRMTQQQAIQLLEALRSEEKMLRPTPVITNRTDRSSRKLKDW